MSLCHAGSIASLLTLDFSQVIRSPRRSPSPVAEKRVKLSHTPASLLEDTPSSSRPPAKHIPTGPKADRQAQPPSQSAANVASAAAAAAEVVQSVPAQLDVSESLDDEEMTQTRGRGRGRSAGSSRQPSASRGGPSSSKLPVAPTIIQPPLYDRTFILNSYSQGAPLKPQWAENPKSPLANYVGSNLPIKYDATHGVLGGQKLVRWVITGIGRSSIDGTGSLCWRTLRAGSPALGTHRT